MKAKRIAEGVYDSPSEEISELSCAGFLKPSYTGEA